MVDQRRFIEQNNPKSQVVTQYGLYTESPEETEKMITRVKEFNLKHLDSPVRMNILDTQNGDENCPRPHVKFVFQFPSTEAQRAFWLG